MQGKTHENQILFDSEIKRTTHRNNGKTHKRNQLAKKNEREGKIYNNVFIHIIILIRINRHNISTCYVFR